MPDQSATLKNFVEESISAINASISLNYNPNNLNGVPESELGLWKTASAVKIKTYLDTDGNIATTDDRVAKSWNVKLYKNSIAPENLIDSQYTPSMLAATHIQQPDQNQG